MWPKLPSVNKAIRNVTKENDILLWIILDTKRIKKTKISKRARFGSRNEPGFKHVVMLPFEVIQKSKNKQRAFLLHVCDVLDEMLKEYGVPQQNLDKIRMQCLEEIVGNPKYVYDEEG